MARKLNIESFLNIVINYSQTYNVSFLSEDVELWFNNNYESTRTKIPFKCEKCNYNYTKSIINIRNGQGCPKCAKLNKKRRTNKEIQSERLKMEENLHTPIKNIMEFLLIDLKIPEEYIELNKFGKLDIVINIPNRQMIGINIISLRKNSFGKEIPYSHKHKYRLKAVTNTDLAEIKNINLLSIFENEFENEFQNKIWKSIIINKLGMNSTRLYARKTYIKEVPNNLARTFLEENHMQQAGAMGSVKLGLFTKDTHELVSLMTFGKGRYNKMPGFEMIRYCNKIGCSVIGAANKLFKYFINNYLSDDQIIVSYANRKYAYRNKNIYKTLGFKETAISEPNYFYFEEEKLNKNFPESLKTLKLYSRVNFQKHKLKDKLKVFDPKEIEMINMFNNGYRSIWDPGNFVYIFKK